MKYSALYEKRKRFWRDKEHSGGEEETVAPKKEEGRTLKGGKEIL